MSKRLTLDEQKICSVNGKERYGREKESLITEKHGGMDCCVFLWIVNISKSINSK